MCTNPMEKNKDLKFEKNSHDDVIVTSFCLLNLCLTVRAWCNFATNWSLLAEKITPWNLCIKSMGKFKYSKMHNKLRDDVMMTSFIQKIFCVGVFIGCKFDIDWRLLIDPNCASKTCTKWMGRIKYWKIYNKSADDVIMTSCF